MSVERPIQQYHQSNWSSFPYEWIRVEVKNPSKTDKPIVFCEQGGLMLVKDKTHIKMFNSSQNIFPTILPRLNSDIRTGFFPEYQPTGFQFVLENLSGLQIGFVSDKFDRSELKDTYPGKGVGDFENTYSFDPLRSRLWGKFKAPENATLDYELNPLVTLPRDGVGVGVVIGVYLLKRNSKIYFCYTMGDKKSELFEIIGGGEEFYPAFSFSRYQLISWIKPKGISYKPIDIESVFEENLSTGNNDIDIQCLNALLGMPFETQDLDSEELYRLYTWGLASDNQQLFKKHDGYYLFTRKDIEGKLSFYDVYMATHKETDRQIFLEHFPKYSKMYTQFSTAVILRSGGDWMDEFEEILRQNREDEAFLNQTHESGFTLLHIAVANNKQKHLWMLMSFMSLKAMSFKNSDKENPVDTLIRLRQTKCICMLDRLYQQSLGIDVPGELFDSLPHKKEAINFLFDLWEKNKLSIPSPKFVNSEEHLSSKEQLPNLLGKFPLTLVFPVVSINPSDIVAFHMIFERLVEWNWKRVFIRSKVPLSTKKFLIVASHMKKHEFQLLKSSLEKYLHYDNSDRVEVDKHFIETTYFDSPSFHAIAEDDDTREIIAKFTSFFGLALFSLDPIDVVFPSQSVDKNKPQ
eukprot:TRINITY_DN634_c0_g2_i1.p1 TRINITY_DN634_c0_g2~~TRINITY_DN634_c0_g2_i1.p1  ORF type:complete len:633 (-),score=88.36 TRINITY_DN634_c0_g2_i1:1042-2940(-)